MDAEFDESKVKRNAGGQFATNSSGASAGMAHHAEKAAEHRKGGTSEHASTARSHEKAAKAYGKAIEHHDSGDEDKAAEAHKEAQGHAREAAAKERRHGFADGAQANKVEAPAKEPEMPKEIADHPNIPAEKKADVAAKIEKPETPAEKAVAEHPNIPEEKKADVAAKAEGAKKANTPENKEAHFIAGKKIGGFKQNAEGNWEKRGFEGPLGEKLTTKVGREMHKGAAQGKNPSESIRDSIRLSPKEKIKALALLGEEASEKEFKPAVPEPKMDKIVAPKTVPTTKLTNDEINAVRDYTEDGNVDNIQMAAKSGTGEHAETAKKIQQAIEKSKLVGPAVLRRGIGDGDPLIKMKPGETWSPGQFVSATGSDSVADDFGEHKVTIHAAEGDTALRLTGSMREGGDEKEYLFPKNAKFKVESNEPGHTVVRMIK